MTIDERVEGLIIALYDEEPNLYDAREILSLALQDVARDQRHACDEAVLDVHGDGNFKIDRDQARQAVMNAEVK